jgi:cytochrome c-type biogenesis protein CcmH/NrfF
MAKQGILTAKGDPMETMNLEKLTKKVRCTQCREKKIDGTEVNVVRGMDEKKKVRAYLCTTEPCITKYFASQSE